MAQSSMAQLAGGSWQRHTIDAGSRGADGVRVADINGDGLLDLTTGWEEGGQVRMYVNPGPDRCRELWPHVIVGSAASVEDAVFVDLNGDGHLDIVASCEGRHRELIAFVSRGAQPLRADNWQRANFSAGSQQQQWMFALPMELDDAAGIDVVVGSKGPSASISWLRSPSATLSSSSLDRWCGEWTLQRLTDAGWIMSLRQRDMDDDGDQDIVFSDRRGNESGLWWLENPGSLAMREALQRPTLSWTRHLIGAQGQEVMFMDLADIDGDSQEDAVAAVSGGAVVIAFRQPGASLAWRETAVAMPAGVGTGKAARGVDVDLDGRMDLVISCENSARKSGVFWLRQSSRDTWEARDISGQAQGVKFDRVELLDLDADGDSDLITCEERDNLGVIWYENPTR